MKKEELKENQEIEEVSENGQKPRGFFGKLGSGIKTGVKVIGEKVGDGIKKVQTNMDNHFEQKQIEKDLEEFFNDNSIKLSLVMIKKRKSNTSIW